MYNYVNRVTCRVVEVRLVGSSGLGVGLNGATLGVIRRDGTGDDAQARMWILQLRMRTSRNGRQLASARRRPQKRTQY
ncbi:unnamed protein product [Arctogadus glacialis]